MLKVCVVKSHDLNLQIKDAATGNTICISINFYVTEYHGNEVL
jgi:hypothetical protein